MGSIYKNPHLKVLCDFADEALEGKLADEQLGRLLVPANFAKGNCARTETMWLLHTAGCLREGGLIGSEVKKGKDRLYARELGPFSPTSRQAACEEPYLVVNEHQWQ